MVKTSRERTAKHRAIKASIAFSNDYLDGNTKVTPEEFIEAKISELQERVFGVVTEFNAELVNPFYDGLRDLEVSDGYYDVSDLFILWKSILDELG